MPTEAVEVETRIAASAHAVWQVLVEANRWSDWNSGVDGVDGLPGIIEPGSTFYIRAGGGTPRRVWVTVWGEDEVLIFTSGWPFGLFTSLRTYSIAEYNDETIFHTRQAYSGPLAPYIVPTLPSTQHALQRFAEGVKDRAERTFSNR